MKINERVYVKSDFKDLLYSMNVGIVDYIIVYKVEGDKVFFKANSAKLHLTKGEFKDVCLSEA
jgi:hypothetical protein